MNAFGSRQCGTVTIEHPVYTGEHTLRPHLYMFALFYVVRLVSYFLQAVAHSIHGTAFLQGSDHS